MRISTLNMIRAITENPKTRYKTEIEGKEIIAFYNQNGGISIGRSNLNMSGEVLGAKWELVNKRYTFMEAVNSGKRIKHEVWDKFTTTQEALYDLLDQTVENVIQTINGHWNIEE